MSRFGEAPSEEYRAPVEQLRSLAADDSAEGDVVRAVAEGLEDHLRARFRAHYDVDAPAASACLGQLVAGWEECRHVLPQHGTGTEPPPHHPPHADHAHLWLDGTEPAVFAMHLYDVGSPVLRDLLTFADEWGLGIDLPGFSWYFASTTTCIVLYPPERLERTASQQ